eukprot:2581763-Rhodomonas_salina.1
MSDFTGKFKLKQPERPARGHWQCPARRQHWQPGSGCETQPTQPGPQPRCLRPFAATADAA